MKMRSKRGLVGVNGNAFAIMAHMKVNLQKVGWKPEDISLLLKEMQSDDYNHLLAVACTFTDEGDSWELEDEDDDGEDDEEYD
jgi:hypothetical protein